MPFVTFTVRRGLSNADKSLSSAAMLEAQMVAGFHRTDRLHRFLEVDRDDLLVDPRFPDCALAQKVLDQQNAGGALPRDEMKQASPMSKTSVGSQR